MCTVSVDVKHHVYLHCVQAFGKTRVMSYALRCYMSTVVWDQSDDTMKDSRWERTEKQQQQPHTHTHTHKKKGGRVRVVFLFFVVVVGFNKNKVFSIRFGCVA